MASAQSDELGAADAQASGEPMVNVQIVSPSVGVNRPLLFPGTPASTTIKQLKEKIREALPLRPADEHQRLIHRGRALMRDSDSLLDVLGAESVSSMFSQLQLIHHADLLACRFNSQTNIRFI